MYSLCLLGFTSFLIAFLTTPFVRGWFRRLGVVDHPDARRKLHSEAIPRVGGVIIASAYVLAYAILLLTRTKGSNLVLDGLPLFTKLAPAAALVLATGLLDDLIGLKPWQKLIGQLAAALVACFGGVAIHNVGSHQLAPWLAMALTV